MLLTVTASTATTGRRRLRQPTRLWRVPVLRVEPLAPTMVRVTAGGDSLAGFTGTGTDQHVKLYLYEPGAELPDPLTTETARAAMHRVRPAMRSYTIRRHDPATREIDIDFVLHDAPGPASDWARRAAPGDDLIFVGPSPAYEPAAGVHSWLLVGDSSALPAIEAICRELPAGTRARVLLDLADPAERRELPSAATVSVSYPHGPDELVDAVRAEQVPGQDLDVWVAGERSVVQQIRAYLLGERRLDRRHLRPTSYWRRGHSGS